MGYSSWVRKEFDMTELLSFSLFIPSSFMNPCTHAFIYFSIHACIVHKIIDLHIDLFWPPDAKN